MSQVLKHFKLPFAATLIALVLSFIIGGVEVAGIVAILAVLEISLSFDNAVVNAKYLDLLPAWWRQLFLTLGVIIAVFFMRFAFPIIIVSVTAHLAPWTVLDIAVNHPSEYAHHLDEAHAGIAALGGTFLLMIFFGWLFDDEKELHWIPFERHFPRIGRFVPAVVVTIFALVVVGQLYVRHDFRQFFVFGLVGIGLNVAVSTLNDLYEENSDEELAEDGSLPSRTGRAAIRTGQAAFATFLFLEVLDASFSFDGVTGAFAISQNIFIIAAGLGVGAFYIRALTVWLVEVGALEELPYLEHGAHWAIGALAVILIITVEHKVPEWVTGLIGVSFIFAALGSSLRYRKQHPKLSEPTGKVEAWQPS